jgi:hypothetical protein
MEVKTQHQVAPSHDERARARMQRFQKLRQRPGIRVVPKNDDMRRLLKHPQTGHFRAEGGLEWPNDTFTFKRLRDGDIIRESEVKTKANREAEAHESEARESEMKTKPNPEPEAEAGAEANKSKPPASARGSRPAQQ